jgi:hypothetical protein
VGARIPRCSCSSTTLVLAPSAPLVWVSVAEWLVRSAGQRRRLRPRLLAEWRVDT